jgi:quercetin dioxygenase-like cupin family protein
MKDEEGMERTQMADNYVYIRELREQARVPQNGILSQTLYDDGKTKVILFGFAPGQELSAHTAPFPAILTFLRGEAALKLGTDEQEAVEGTFVYMHPNLEHGVKAKTDVVMLLTMIKSPAPISGA